MRAELPVLRRSAVKRGRRRFQGSLESEAYNEFMIIEHSFSEKEHCTAFTPQSFPVGQHYIAV